MLRSTNEVLGYRLHATDGSIGHVHDISFDDRTWTVRYVVVNTGGWLSGRKVLLSPVCFGAPQWREKAIPVSLTKEQIEKSPGIDSEQTVSRQHETELHKHYGWPPYWSSYPVGGIGWIPLPTSMPPEGEEESESSIDSNLRSVREVGTYSIHAENGDVGHVEDFLVDDETWAIRYIEVNTRNWLPGRKVLISPEWVSSIRWDEEKVYIGMSRELIKGGPGYDPSKPVTREYEELLHDYYGRPKYWRP